MGRQRLLNIRIDEERRTRWDSAAADAGETLSDFIRDAVDHRVEVGSLVVPADAERETVKRQDSPAGRVQPGAASRPTPAAAGGKVFKGPDPKPEGRKK